MPDFSQLVGAAIPISVDCDVTTAQLCIVPQQLSMLISSVTNDHALDLQVGMLMVHG